MLYQLSYTLSATWLRTCVLRPAAARSDMVAGARPFVVGLRAATCRRRAIRDAPLAFRRRKRDTAQRMNFDDALIRGRLKAASDTNAAQAEQVDDILAIGRAVRDRLDKGGAVFTCGNGGSAAEALHLAEELIGKYRAARPPRRAVCLNADPTALTCIANDFGFDEVFARQVEGLARDGDALIVFSTSGASPNIVKALRKARDGGVLTIGLLGRDGGACLPLSDLSLVVRSQETAHIQEAHQVVLHLILEAVEAA